VFLQGVTDGVLSYVFLHFLDVFSQITFFNSKIYAYLNLYLNVVKGISFLLILWLKFFRHASQNSLRHELFT
jgi:hypothetical protein